MARSRKKRSKVEWKKAPDIKKRANQLIKNIGIDWLDETSIYCFRSANSKSRAYARIWGLSRIWQQALDKKPAYIIEVISEKFEKLDKNNQDKVLLHEIAHIPHNFSGSIVPHYRKGKRKFSDRVKELVSTYNSNK